MKSLSYAAFSLFLMASAHATDVTVFGSGTLSCGAFVASGENSARSPLYMAWAGGYLSSSNNQKDRLLTIDMDGAMGWLRNYCKANPLDSYFTALVNLDHVLDHHAANAASP